MVKSTLEQSLFDNYHNGITDLRVGNTLPKYSI